MTHQPRFFDQRMVFFGGNLTSPDYLPMKYQELSCAFWSLKDVPIAGTHRSWNFTAEVPSSRKRNTAALGRIFAARCRVWKKHRNLRIETSENPWCFGKRTGIACGNQRWRSGKSTMTKSMGIHGYTVSMIFTGFVLLVLKMIDSHCHVWSQECRCQPWAHVGQEVQGNNGCTSEMKLYTVECSKFEKGHPFFLRWFHRRMLFFMLVFLRSFRCTVGFSRCDWFGVCCQLGMEPWNETTTCLAHLVLVISWLRTHDGEHQELIGAKGHTCSLQQPATACNSCKRNFQTFESRPWGLSFISFIYIHTIYIYTHTYYVES